MKSSFKTGRQRRTNQQKLKRSKAALASRKAQREVENKQMDNQKKGFLLKMGALQHNRGGITRYRTQSRFAAFRAWAGEKFTKLKRVFRTKKQKERDRMWEMHMGKGLDTERYLKGGDLYVPKYDPEYNRQEDEKQRQRAAGGDGDGRYYREAIKPPVPHIDGIYG